MFIAVLIGNSLVICACVRHVCTVHLMQQLYNVGTCVKSPSDKYAYASVKKSIDLDLRSNLV